MAVKELTTADAQPYFGKRRWKFSQWLAYHRQMKKGFLILPVLRRWPVSVGISRKCPTAC